MKNVGNNSRGRSQGVPKIFMAPMYRAHCAVIFAIAQLSCSVMCVYIFGTFSLFVVFSTCFYFLRYLASGATYDSTYISSDRTSVLEFFYNFEVCFLATMQNGENSGIRLRRRRCKMFGIVGQAEGTR